jgi:uncharacterized protein with PhoU and TrkA domain
MGMTAHVAQARIARELVEAEQAIDEALIRQSQLFTSLVTARRDLGMASTYGQDALLRLAKSQQAMLDAGGDLARVHGRMLKIGEEVTGDLASDCPSGGKTQPMFHGDNIVVARTAA